MYVNPSTKLEVAMLTSHYQIYNNVSIFNPKQTTHNAFIVRKHTLTLCLARSNQSLVLCSPLVDPVNGSLVIARDAEVPLELKRRRGASRDGLKVV